MIHGYHTILPMYGFWLPNDPRGSWSEFVRKWELVEFGQATKSCSRRALEQLPDEEVRRFDGAKKSLRYPPVSINGQQALSIATGFATQASKSKYTIWACSILPTHTHIVSARHSYEVEKMANLLKGAATRQIIEDRIHPLAEHSVPGKRPPRMWSSGMWKSYLDSEEAIDEAIHYVENNPVKEDMPEQRWSFVTPFSGISRGGWVTYH